MKRVIVISTSLRQGSNSDMLADKFVEGAKAAGNDVEKVALAGREIQFCKGCMGCQRLGRCVIKDDVNDIMVKVMEADVVVWATPIYYYEKSGQVKTLIDRMNAMYPLDYKFRDVYLLTTAAEDEEETPRRAEAGLTGWIDCYPKSQLAGTLFCGGVNEAREIEGNSKLRDAYEMGRYVLAVLRWLIMKHVILGMLAAGMLPPCTEMKKQTEDNDMEQNITLTQGWDKVFQLSEKVNHRKVTFDNQYGLTLAADLYEPKNAQGEQAAIAVSGPFGAVKEQASGLYAMRMAERGFVTLAFDPSYTGESSGTPRRTASIDINTEDFMAAVDYLSGLENVDAEKIGIIGICGWGGIALNAAAADTRIKATVASTMYDMTRVSGNGYFDSEDKEESRHAAREALAKQRLADPMAMAGGVIDPLPDDAPQFAKDYHDYYKTDRGYHARSGNSNDGWRAIGTQAYANSRFLCYINEIRSAVMVLHGEKAHSRYFGEAAYKYMVEGKAEGYNFIGKPNPVPENKQLLIVPTASHCDLYDGGYTELSGSGEPKNLIPWDKLEAFFKENLK